MAMNAPTTTTRRRPQVQIIPPPIHGPNPVYHPPNHPGLHPGRGSGGGQLGPGPTLGNVTPNGAGGPLPGIHPDMPTTPNISTPFYGTDRGGDTQFAINRLREGISRAPAGYSPEVIQRQRADAARMTGFRQQANLAQAARSTGGPGNAAYALLAQLGGAGATSDLAGLNADITRAQEDRIKADQQYSDSLAGQLAGLTLQERGIQSNEAGRRTDLENNQAQFNRGLTSSEQQANANRGLQGQGMNLDAAQWQRQFEDASRRGDFNQILQLISATGGDLSNIPAQLRSTIQNLISGLRLPGGGSGLGGGLGNLTDRPFRGYANGGTHPGGPALTGEQGFEIKIGPNGRVGLTGLNGPEVSNMAKGTTVIPHPASMAMMGRVPAYEHGTRNINPYAGILSRSVNPVGIMASNPTTAAMWANIVKNNPGPIMGGPIGDAGGFTPQEAQQYWNSHQFQAGGTRLKDGRFISGVTGDVQEPRFGAGGWDQRLAAADAQKARDAAFYDADAGFESDQRQARRGMVQGKLDESGYGRAMDQARQRYRERIQPPGYANGTPDWRSYFQPQTEDSPGFVGPPSNLAEGYVPNAPLLPDLQEPPPQQTTFTEYADPGGPLPPALGGAIPSGSGLARINGKLIAVNGPDTSGQLAQRNAFRDSLRGGLASGDFSSIDPVAIAMEAQNNPYGPAPKALRALDAGLPMLNAQRQNRELDQRIKYQDRYLGSREDANDIRRAGLEQNAYFKGQQLNLADRAQRIGLIREYNARGDRQKAHHLTVLGNQLDLAKARYAKNPDDAEAQFALEQIGRDLNSFQNNLQPPSMIEPPNLGLGGPGNNPPPGGMTGPPPGAVRIGTQRSTGHIVYKLPDGSRAAYPAQNGMN